MKIILTIALIFISGCVAFDWGDAHYASLGGKSFDRAVVLIIDPNGATLIEIINYNSEGVGPIAESVVRGLMP